MRVPNGLMIRYQGMTKVELLVVVACIAILMGLLIPAVNTGDRRGRRNECSTKLNNFAKAAIQYEMRHGQFPGYVNDFGSYTGDHNPAEPDLVGATYRTGDKKLGSWVVALLPMLDAQPTYEIWTEPQYPLLKTVNGITSFTDSAAPNISYLQCPSSPTVDSEQGRNSYIANTGMHHLTAEGRPLMMSRRVDDVSSPTGLLVTFAESMRKANGVFNNQYEKATNSADYPAGPAMKSADMKDGAGNTMLFAESLQAIPWHQLDPDPAAAVRLLQPEMPGDEVAYPEYSRFTQGMVWLYEDPDGANGSPKVPDERRQIINSTPQKTDLFSLRMDHENAVIVARPSSAHAEGFNASFADGSSRYISETIDYRVYQALLTPSGKSSLLPDPSFVPPADGL